MVLSAQGLGVTDERVQYGLETEVAKHLSDNYGDCAWTVCSYANPTGKAWPLHGVRLAPGYPCKSSLLDRKSVV